MDIMAAGVLPSSFLNPTQPLKNNSNRNSVKGYGNENLRSDKNKRTPTISKVIVANPVPQRRHRRQTEVISFHHVRNVHTAPPTNNLVSALALRRDQHVHEGEEQHREQVHNKEQGEDATGGGVQQGVEPVVPVKGSVEPGATFTEDFPFCERGLGGRGGGGRGVRGARGGRGARG